MDDGKISSSKELAATRSHTLSYRKWRCNGGSTMSSTAEDEKNKNRSNPKRRRTKASSDNSDDSDFDIDAHLRGEYSR